MNDGWNACLSLAVALQFDCRWSPPPPPLLITDHSFNSPPDHATDPSSDQCSLNRRLRCRIWWMVRASPLLQPPIIGHALRVGLYDDRWFRNA